MSSTFQLCAILALVVVCTMAKPVNRKPHPGDPVEGDSPEHKKPDEALGLAYEHYLKEVVDVLESDAAFKKKLETSNVTDIKSGKIAMYLELVNHTVRDMLHELKRKELARLSQLARIQMKSQSGAKKFEIPDHLDLGNQHTFEIKDLERLIKKTTSDLEKLDEQRREEFKEYEMEKKFEQEEHLKELNEADRKKEEEHQAELKKKHKEHPKVNHPGSKDQFEEVWDQDDHLGDMDFDPKTFFMTHDINGDFEWSIDEVDAVLQRELDKVYDPNGDPQEDDPIERDEEMNRMREHIFTEMDRDKNLRISLSEFLAYTGQHGENKEFQKDEGWKTIDEEDPVFDEEDYLNYIKQHHPQPGVVDPPVDPNLHFQPEQHQQQQQQQLNQHQQQFNQQQQQFNQQQQQFHQQQQHFNQQQQQLNQQQQFNQQAPPHHQQQQFNQGGQHQQQFVKDNINVPQQQQQQHQQQQPNQGVPQQEDNKFLQQQLHDLQEKLNQQQQNMVNQPPASNNQQVGQGQAPGQGH